MSTYTLAEFQHQILRRLVFNTKGSFVADLMYGREEALHRFLATRVAGNAAVTVTLCPEDQGILLVFSPPQNPTECHYIFLSTKGEPTRFFTCESAQNLFGVGPLAIFCELCANGSRHNYGTMPDSKLETFMTKIRLLFVDKAQ
jgi:hypothetical protein